MLKNFMTITLRNFIRQKSFAFINIIGLSIGLSSAIFIFLYIYDELGYDKMHPDVENTYRIGATFTFENGNSFNSTNVPAIWSSELREQFPEVKNISRYLWFGYPTSINYREKDKILLTEELLWVEPTFTDLLYLDLKKGNKEKALELPNSLLISENVANQLFGDEDPIGKMLAIKHPWATNNEDLEVIVTGMFDDYPSNSHIKPDYLINMEGLKPAFGDEYDQLFQNWQGGWMSTYVNLEPGSDLSTLQSSLSDMIDKNLPENAPDIQPVFRNIQNIHFDAEMRWGTEDGTEKSYLYVFGSIAVLILLIACINYMNLATARSVKRFKEVGIRKTMGSSRKLLIYQFMNESFLTTLLSLIISLVLVVIFMPLFNILAQKSFSVNHLLNPGMVLIILSVILFITFAAGSYPSLYLSGFKPVNILKGKMSSAKGGTEILRKILVIGQYAITLLLIICTVLILKQMDMMQNNKLNEAGNQMISIRFGGTAPVEKYPVFRDLVNNDNELNQITVANHLPRQNYFGGIGANFRIPEISDEQYQWSKLNVEFNFTDLFNLEFIAGRDFIRDNPADSNAYLLNESAVQELGISAQEAIGININDESSEINGTIIGVVKDFPYQSMQEAIGPLAISGRPHPIDQIIYVKLPQGKIQEKISYLENQWKVLFPGIGFDYWFVNEEFGRMYESEDRLADLTQSFSVLAILIACLGLFGLASYMTERKTKEIGIRKVMGATLSQIFLLFFSVFLKMMLIAVLIAIPLGYFVMNDWLQEFVYRIPISWESFLLAVAIVFVLTIITVGYELFKASASNAAEALRYE